MYVQKMLILNLLYIGESISYVKRILLKDTLTDGIQTDIFYNHMMTEAWHIFLMEMGMGNGPLDYDAVMGVEDTHAQY